MPRHLISDLWHILPLSLRGKLWQVVETAYQRGNRVIDALFDLGYGIETSLVAKYKPGDWIGGKFRDSKANIPTPVVWLVRLRTFLCPTHEDVFMDVGCGTGRAVFVFARSYARRSRGIELHDVAYDYCIRNARSFRFDKSKIEFINEDACSVEIRDETIILIANPFGINTLRSVMQNIEHSLKSNPRTLRLCYYNPREHRQYIESVPWLRALHELKGFKNTIVIYEAMGFGKSG